MANYKKPDYWQLKARKEGYPARSVYKLQEMDEKFGLLKPARPFRVLDLGAAPGSWSLYILRKWEPMTAPREAVLTKQIQRVPAQEDSAVSGKGSSPLGERERCGREKGNSHSRVLIAADISPLSRQYDQGLFNSENFHFIQGGITDAAVRDSILALGPYNLIISDAAPATTGSRFLDTSRSLELAETVLLCAESALTENGGLVVKLFQGGDSADLLKRVKALFKTAKSYKPQACRGESFEAYYLGTGKK
jgi:23S rRNA (uridine2552-2'-O)-methyltransferase